MHLQRNAGTLPVPGPNALFAAIRVPVLTARSPTSSNPGSSTLSNTSSHPCVELSCSQRRSDGLTRPATASPMRSRDEPSSPASPSSSGVTATSRSAVTHHARPPSALTRAATSRATVDFPAPAQACQHPHLAVRRKGQPRQSSYQHIPALDRRAVKPRRHELRANVSRPGRNSCQSPAHYPLGGVSYGIRANLLPDALDQSGSLEIAVLTEQISPLNSRKRPAPAKVNVRNVTRVETHRNQPHVPRPAAPHLLSSQRKLLVLPCRADRACLRETRYENDGTLPDSPPDLRPPVLPRPYAVRIPPHANASRLKLLLQPVDIR